MKTLAFARVSLLLAVVAPSLALAQSAAPEASPKAPAERQYSYAYDMLDNSVRSDWPPYNIEKIGDDDYRNLYSVNLIADYLLAHQQTA